MRNLILRLLKNQRYLFITVFGGLIILFTSWYFLVQKGLSKEHKRSSNARIVLEKDVDKFRKMESQIIGLEAEWNDINSQFEMVIDKIPDKRLFDNVTDFLYSMIVNQGLKIQSFSPSNAAIEKKTILVPETGDEITIEKVPIDITLRGSFINFGQLLESMKIGKYRITASNIEILQKQKASAQTIKLISYAYFQSSNNKPLAQATTTPIIKKKNAQTTKAVNQSNDTIKKVEPTKVVDNNVKTIDSLEGVPEMWLEPATEPVEESIVAEKPAPTVKPREKKQKPVKPKEIVNLPVKEEAAQEVIPERAMPFVEKMVVLESLACKKVKNNQPLYPGRRFPTDVGRVYCHTLLNNNSGKNSDIYHIWYMNGSLKAKVRIRVRGGKEIPAFSHREIKSNDKGTWKVEITDSDKKILDTVIFEVV
tara:strand:- start:3423 stop:4688 length:1266 start_codon:yes stop_codon:yes gene_type:complete